MNLIGIDFWRIPEGMRNRSQWCLTGANKSPQLVGSNGLYNASPVSGPWLDFETACHYARQYSTGIGYMICEADPYTCIDLDIKDAESVDPKTGQPLPRDKWTTRHDLDFYCGILEFAGSYAELSMSGKGLHIWVEGNIGSGRRGKGIEIYSKERFIACTGNPVSDLSYATVNGVVFPHIKRQEALPITDGTMLLDSLVKELGLAAAQIDLEEHEQQLDDSQIWERALSAGNGEKFRDLCAGRWTEYSFPSQSEADLALMSMFTFYSPSNEQCRRMFRQTVLGQRDKAVQDDVYLNRTLKIIRGRQAAEKGKEANGEMLAQALLQNMNSESTAPPIPAPPVDHGAPLRELPQVRQMMQTLDQTQYTVAEPNVVNFELPEVEGLEWPPGLTGAVAGFIYRSAPRPVKEVAIVAALGLMAGIVGKAYNVGQTGLNLYIILIARSAIGKEAMHSGIGHILKSPCGPALVQFVDFTDYASGPALTKATEKKPSFVNVSGEWGRKLQRMADDKRDGPMQQLRTSMTNIYQKSGSASVVGGIGYSDKDKNVASVNAVAYSMIGETTPGTFYDSLTQTMMEDGFLSRFNVVEYLGERPAQNDDQIMQVPKDISDTLGEIAAHASGIIYNPNAMVIQIQQEPVAQAMLDEFNDYCDSQIHAAGPDESIRQIWNRAHLKAVRTAGVLAAADNHRAPVIQEQHVQWALALIKSDATGMLNKIRGGDIGVDDASRFKKFLGVIEPYLKGKVAPSYNIDPRMIKDGIVPKKYLQQRLSQVRCFRDHKLGSSAGLDHTIRSAIEAGYIMEVSKEKVVEMYSCHGRAFRVLDLHR